MFLRRPRHRIDLNSVSAHRATPFEILHLFIPPRGVLINLYGVLLMSSVPVAAGLGVVVTGIGLGLRGRDHGGGNGGRVCRRSRCGTSVLPGPQGKLGGPDDPGVLKVQEQPVLTGRGRGGVGGRPDWSDVRPEDP